MISVKILSERQNHRCAYCGTRMTFDTTTICYSLATRDHYIPKSKKGSNDEANLIAACYLCNTHRKSTGAIKFFNRVQRLKIKSLVYIEDAEYSLRLWEQRRLHTNKKVPTKLIAKTRRRLARLQYYARQPLAQQ